MTHRTGQLLSINVAQATHLHIGERQVLSAIGKRAVSSLEAPARVAVTPLGVEGDEQVDNSAHGGLAKAVYAYPSEHYPFWQTVRAQAKAAGWDAPLPNGMMGENLTIKGLLEGDVWVGDVLRFPDCSLAVSEPRRPCFKFQHIMGFNQAVKMMAQSGYSGFYLAVRVPGSLVAGESFEVIPGPREVNLRELFLAKMRKEANGG